jgi:protein-S-isoprenylcysteine O-methyltransferase Ste14
MRLCVRGGEDTAFSIWTIFGRNCSAMGAEPAGIADRPRDVGKLKRAVFVRGFVVLGVLGITLFVPAGTLAYWEAWVFMAIVAIPAAFFLSHLLRTDPQVLERRMRVKEKEPGQKTIMKFSYAVFILSFLTPGFDRRFGLSSVPFVIILAADVIVFLGYVIFVIVVKANRYASRIIEVEPGQRVISTGPYAVVRHPMYVGALLINVFAPLALGSYWAMIASVLFIPIFVARIMNEEVLLTRELHGYADYTRRTRYRLIPGIW